MTVLQTLTLLMAASHLPIFRIKVTSYHIVKKVFFEFILSLQRSAVLLSSKKMLKTSLKEFKEKAVVSCCCCCFSGCWWLRRQRIRLQKAYVSLFIERIAFFTGWAELISVFCWFDLFWLIITVVDVKAIHKSLAISFSLVLKNLAWVLSKRHLVSKSFTSF